MVIANLFGGSVELGEEVKERDLWDYVPLQLILRGRGRSGAAAERVKPGREELLAGPERGREMVMSSLSLQPETEVRHVRMYSVP